MMDHGLCISETISEGDENRATCNEVNRPSTELMSQERVDTSNG